jgi:aarF domain-containing kinase
LDVKSWKQSVFIQAELPLPQPLTITNTTEHAGISNDTKDWHLSFPCNVRLARRPTGLDFRLHLFNLRIGDPSSSSSSTLHQSPFSTNTTNNNSNSNVDILDRAAGLLFAKVLFPDTISPTLHFATVAWCATALLKQTSKHYNLTLSPSKLGKLHNKLYNNNKSWTKTTLVPLMSSTFKAVASLAQRYGEPAAWLTAAATVWAIVNPSSYKVGECIAALIPVLAGYNQTARKCEKGLIVDQEGAWYGVHRWAARRTAHLLTRLSADNPPLGQVIDVWEGLDIRLGSSRINNKIHSTSGWATAAAMQHSNGGSEFWGSISLGGGSGGGNKGRNKKRNIAKATTGSIQTEKLNGEAHFASVAKTPLKTGKSLSTSLASSSSGGPGPGIHHHRPSSGNLMDSPADWSSSPRSSSFVDNSSEDGLAVGTASNNNNNNNNNNVVVTNSDKDDESTCWLDDDETSAALAEVTAALYGRADHLLGEEDEDEGADGDQNVGIAEKLRLTMRGIHLVAIFAPFIVFGTVLLLAASSIAARRQQRIGRKGIVTGDKGGSKDDDDNTVARATITPAPSFSVPIDARMRTAAFKLLLWACRQSGAAFIKWGQWASTREDIFPDDFCRILSNLHDQAPEHSYQQSRSIIEQSFNGKTIEDMFVWFDPVPLASGSIAQVHKAGLRMSVVDGRPLPPSYNDDGDDEGEESVLHTVAVKVRHPGVAQQIWEDFQVLRPFAAMTSRVRSLKGLGLKDTVNQFSHTMTAQADLRVEAAHLTRFYSNFKSLSSTVIVPKPIRGMTREAVLVETFEPGLSVAKFIRQPAPCNTKIVSIGVDTYLKMLLSDNFVHTDLHPGNILVRPASIDPGNTNNAEDASKKKKKKSMEEIMMKDGDEGPVQLILLDFGLAEELTPRVRRHFIGFLNAISAGDGPTAAGHLLNWATRQKCPDPAALITDVEELFKKDCNIHQPGGIDLDRVMKSILHLARKHEVSIDSGYAALVVGVCVIVGFATGLDPRVNLMDAATPCMLYYNLTGRVAGRLYS